MGRLHLVMLAVVTASAAGCFLPSYSASESGDGASGTGATSTGGGGTGASGTGASGGTGNAGGTGGSGNSGNAGGEGGMGNAGGNGGAAVMLQPPTCSGMGKTDQYFDNFNNGTLANIWTWFGTGSYEEAGGVFTITPVANVEGDNFGSIYLQEASLSDCEISTRVTEVLGPNVPGQVALYYLGDSANFMTMFASLGSIHVQISSGGSVVDQVEQPWDIGRPYWRIREASNTVTFEVADLAMNWTEVHTISSPGYIDSGGAAVSAGTYDSHPSPGQASFDTFNLLPVP